MMDSKDKMMKFATYTRTAASVFAGTRAEPIKV